ncbi:hypothetical protein [Silvanigrella sp.]|jgi:hypothetical protein|uniref:hypothetical protein n=1 Tax=Silvanigrella sp. TaxID=2024976 RepID=UPI0037C755BA|nr:hypothetical protein [Silvanigrellaceae bacterium]
MAIKLKNNQKIKEELGNWVKLNDAAQILQVSEITLRRKIKSGQIKSELREGKYFVYIKESQLKEKKIDIINFEKYLTEKEIEIKNLKTQLYDQKILIDALEEKLTYLVKRVI